MRCGALAPILRAMPSSLAGSLLIEICSTKCGDHVFLLGMSMTVAFVALAWMEVDKSCC